MPCNPESSLTLACSRFQPRLRFASTAIMVIALAGWASDLMAQEGWGHLTGKIVVTGDAPEAEALRIDTNDRAYCINTGEEFLDRSLVVGAEGGLQDAFVMMYFGRGDDKRPAIHESYAETTATPVELDNKNCRFEPHAIFVRTGQAIRFTNADTIGHNCHIVTMANEENCSLGAGQELDVTLESSDRVPGIVKCDVHPWMEALLLVRDEPYVAITDAEGNFRIENIPAGEWTFQFWHKRSGFLRDLEKDGESAVGRRGELTVTIRDGETFELGELTIDASELTD